MSEHVIGDAANKAHPVLSYEDDPRVVAEQHHDDYSNHVVPRSSRVGRWSLAMTFWSLTSAMVWLFYGALSSSLYGLQNALIAIVLSIITFGLINHVLSRWAIRTGLNSVLLSRQSLGVLGAALTALLVAANSTYFAVFESSVVAVAFNYFTPGVDIRVWYAAIALLMLPLMLGGVQTWMAKLNGFLLPFYLIGLAATLIVVTIRFPLTASWMTAPGVVPAEARPMPGWVMAYVLYMGVWLAMANTPDFARFGRVEDSTFHAHVSFGWVIYTILFLVNGLAGAFLVAIVTPDEPAAEAGVVIAICRAVGLVGLLFIAISQIRINTLNYYEASINTNRFIRTLTGLRVPRLPIVAALTVVVFLLMLTDVFSYLQRMLGWQAVFMVGWVGIVMTHYYLIGKGRDTEFRAQRLPAVTWGLAVWLVATATGIALQEVPGSPPMLDVLAPLISLVISVVLYAVVFQVSSSTRRRESPLKTWADVDDAWNTYIRCARCERSYVAVEIDKDDYADGDPVCDACAVGNRARHFH